MTWQPIETAPHEEDVLLFVPACVTGPARIEAGWASGGLRLPNGHSSMWWHGRATHWQPLPAPPEPANDDALFLASMLTRAEAGERVTLDEVSRLRRLADWADAPPCPGWDGTLDAGETRRAVDDAKGRMGK
jgi:hypothetical protein